MLNEQVLDALLAIDVPADKARAAAISLAEYDPQIRELDKKIDRLDAKFERKLDQLDAKLDRKINELDAKLDRKINELDAKLDRRINDLDAKFEVRFAAIEGRMTLLQWMVGVNTAMLIAVIVKLFRVG